MQLREHRDDLTKKYRMVTERVQRQGEEVSLLDRIIHLGAAPYDFDILCEGFMDIAMDSIVADSGALYFFDLEQQELYFATARGPKAQEVLELDFTLKPGQGLVGACFAEKELIAISDVGRDARFSKEVSDAVGYEVRSIITTPILHNGEALGAIQVMNKKDSDEFTPQELDWFKRLGRYAGYFFGLFLELQAARAAIETLKARPEEKA